MKIQIDRESVVKEVTTITVLVNDVEFAISVNQFNELVVNKSQFGEGEGSIVIKPSVSNLIYLL